jgi:hypothetical protein
LCVDVQPADTQSSAASPAKLAHFKPVMQQLSLRMVVIVWGDGRREVFGNHNADGCGDNVAESLFVHAARRVVNGVSMPVPRGL